MRKRLAEETETRNHVKRIERNCGEIPMKNENKLNEFKEEEEHIKQCSTLMHREAMEKKIQQQINRFSFLCFACSIQYKNRFLLLTSFVLKSNLPRSIMVGWLAKTNITITEHMFVAFHHVSQ